MITGYASQIPFLPGTTSNVLNQPPTDDHTANENKEARRNICCRQPDGVRFQKTTHGGYSFRWARICKVLTAPTVIYYSLQSLCRGNVWWGERICVAGVGALRKMRTVTAPHKCCVTVQHCCQIRRTNILGRVTRRENANVSIFRHLAVDALLSRASASEDSGKYHFPPLRPPRQRALRQNSVQVEDFGGSCYLGSRC